MRLMPVSLGVITSSVFAATPPDAGQSLQQLQIQPPLTTPVMPAPTLNNSTQKDDAHAITDNKTLIPVTQLSFTGNTVFDSHTLNRVAGELKSDTTLSDLQAITQRITTYYRQHGYMLARAYLPPQEISSDTVTIAILEGRLDHINLNNQSKVRTTRIQALLDTQLPSNQPLQKDNANRALILLQTIPSIGVVEGSLQPSKAVGSTDLNINVSAGSRVNGYVSLDNNGNRFTGAERVIGGINLNNLTGFGDQLSLHAALTNQDRMDYGRIVWGTPVGNQGLRIGAAFSQLRYSLGEDFAKLDAYGTARTAAIYGNLPLLITPDNHINTSLSLEYQKLTDITGAIDLNNKRHVKAAVMTISGDFRDYLLYTPAVSAWQIVNTTGSVDLRTPSVLAIDSATAKTAGHYNKVVLSATREQLLPANISVYLSATAQRSNKNLDSSEQLTLGGPNNIRAYPEGEASGDQGWIGKIELRYRLNRNILLLGFYDLGGIVINREPFIQQPNGRHLSGAGVGVNTTWKSYQLKTSLAWRAGSEPPTSDTDRRPRIWVQGSYVF
ncbi:MAG: ShlB/FhaC/HecB family hemolysin secretion/activation protein [Aquirhabdus sp.]